MRGSPCCKNPLEEHRNMEKKIGILFDLDGTLLNTLEDLADAANYALRRLGCPEHDLETVRTFVGNGAYNFMSKVLPKWEDAPTANELFAVYNEYYQVHSRDKTRPYDGVLEAMAQISEKYPVAIVSNKHDTAVKPLCAEFFPGYYALGEVSGCPRKPAPDMVHKAMKELGVDTCIYVGDSEVDVLTAQNSGVPCLTVLWGFRDRQMLEESGAKHFCSEPGQLPECIDSLVGLL